MLDVVLVGTLFVTRFTLVLWLWLARLPDIPLAADICT